MKKIFIGIICLIAVNTVFAQNPEKKWAVGLLGGIEQYNGDLGNGFYSFSQANYMFGELSISRYLNPYFDIAIGGSLGEIGYLDDKTKDHFRDQLMQGNIIGRFNFFPYEEYKLRPYIFAGIGGLSFKDLIDYRAKENKEISNWALPIAGLGVKYNINSTIAIELKESFILSNGDEVDGVKKDSKDMYIMHSLGVVFSLGKVADADGDGISDKKDMCPDTPEGVVVDPKGCPVDTDGDGFADYLDACPEFAGEKTAKGCPDADRDGVADEKDECPNVVGPAKLNGCPDTDGDGILDKQDKCPKTKGLAKFNGCPDTDGDGIEDSKDACPNKRGLPDFNGCPDSDGDGVQDSEDQCPKVAGIKSNKGCPEVKEEVKQVLKKALHGVKFQSGKDIITKSSYPVLDNVADIMSLNTAYKLIIKGHTDSQGKDEANLILSQKRAAAVKQYLVNKGIEENRLKSEGFGETMPVADNATAKGRAENRRVELTIEF